MIKKVLTDPLNWINLAIVLMLTAFMNKSDDYATMSWIAVIGCIIIIFINEVLPRFLDKNKPQ